jgi:uroporphyrinogen-III synthase
MRVLLTRPQAQSEELGAVLEGQGVEWLGEPLLRIVPVPWDPGVIAGKQALLLTSANASRELLRVSGDRRTCRSMLSGRAPRRRSWQRDSRTCRRRAGRRWISSPKSAAMSIRAGRLLHLSGLDITCDLAVGLASAGFAVDRVVAYRAAAVERLSGEVMREISRNRVDVALFLSARTAAIFSNLVLSSGIADACSRMTAIAISRKVTEALRPAGFGRVVAAELPGIGSVVDDVLRVASEGVRDPQGGAFRRYAPVARPPMLPRCRAAPRTLTLGCCDRQGAAGILTGRPPGRPGSSPG